MICGLPKLGSFNTRVCGAKDGICIHRNNKDVTCDLKPKEAIVRKNVQQV